MNNYSIIEDVAVLTSVPEKTLKKFIPIINYCIGHSVHESLCKKENDILINLSIGELHLRVENESLKYRFIPSKSLENILVQTISSNQSPIATAVEEDLYDKIQRTYKEFL